MASVQDSPSRIKAREPALAEKVAFLSKGAAYPRPVTDVIRRETHMSWVFLADDKVYKLKKPVRFPYLDFSTLGHREAAAGPSSSSIGVLHPMSISASCRSSPPLEVSRLAPPERSPIGSS
jgi:hypothetical protein